MQQIAERMKGRGESASVVEQVLERLRTLESQKPKTENPSPAPPVVRTELARDFVAYPTADPELKALRDGMARVLESYPGAAAYFQQAEQLCRQIRSGQGVI